MSERLVIPKKKAPFDGVISKQTTPRVGRLNKKTGHHGVNRRDLDNASTAGVEATLEQAPEQRYNLHLVPDVWVTSSNFVFLKLCANTKG